MFDAVFLKRKGQDADFQFNNGLGHTFVRYGISMTKKSCCSHMQLFFFQFVYVMILQEALVACFLMFITLMRALPF